MECEICGSDTVRVRFGNQSLCMACYNAMMAEELGMDLAKLPNIFAVDDVNGLRHIFEVERQIIGTMILLTARERWEYGYEIAVDGKLDTEQHELFDRLKEKTTRYLSETHLETGVFLTGEPYTNVKDKHIKGVIAYDSANSEAPLIIIDGKPYTWEVVGHLLQAFEGFQVKIEMKDLTDELH